jgi:hypothetical protein
MLVEKRGYGVIGCDLSNEIGVLVGIDVTDGTYLHWDAKGS